MMCRRARTAAGSRRRGPRSVSRWHYSRNGLFRKTSGQAARETFALLQIGPTEDQTVHIDEEDADLVPHATQGAEPVYVAALDRATSLNHVGLGGQRAELLAAELRKARPRLLGGQADGLERAATICSPNIASTFWYAVDAPADSTDSLGAAKPGTH